MDALETATAASDAITGLGSHFMLDMATYAYGGELGFEGIDFYIAGRAGCLGDVPASVVTAAMVFWEPGLVAKAWERSAPVMPRRQAAEEFAGVGHRWGEERLPDDLDAARLAELAGRVVTSATVASAPLFAAWCSLPEPSPDRPKALALHHANALRELQGARHGAAVVAAGISPHAAVALRTPYMLDLFGWSEPHPDKDEVRPDWDGAQADTLRAMAPAFEVLDPTERAELVDLLNGAQAAATAG